MVINNNYNVSFFIQQWQAIIGSAPNRRGRPLPMVDPSCITPMEIAEIKTIVRGDVNDVRTTSTISS